VAGVERGARAFRDLPNLVVVQADVMAPPIPKGRVQKLVSWGVLHLLDDPHAGFRRLASCVAPGGAMFIWMYPHPTEDGGAWRPYYFVRDVMFAKRGHRLPPRVRLLASRALCGAFIVPLYLGYRTRASKAEQYPELRDLGLRDIYDGATMNVFDMLTPQHQHRIARANVESWFEECGFGAVAADGGGDYTAWRVGPQATD
jgi:hypothetical protein